jgi:Rrf2 family iron-sulfur cluster assembly transcriptional regulator
MQFTKAEAYGILGIQYLAEKEKNVITPLSEISEAKDIPEKFLAKIFQSLSRAGITRSHRGVRGGFTLAKDPVKLSVKEILEAIQGPYHLMKCIPDFSICDKDDFCALRELLILAENKLVSTLEEYTLADLCKWQRTKKVRV